MICWRIHHLAETASTNLDARAGVPGEVFTADFQTAGRGRLDHKWLSPPCANVIMSAVLDVVDHPAEQVATLPLVIGLAVVRALETLGFSPMLKWPNDVYLDGLKVAGILCERDGDRVIAGIGINVRSREFPPDLRNRAVALEDIRGTSPSVPEVRDRVLEMISGFYDVWSVSGFAPLHTELLRYDYLRGQSLAVLQTDDDDAPIEGRCGGILPDGSLDVGGTPVYAGEAHVLSHRENI